jgi:uncharacterized membrane protein YkoI
MGATPAPGTEAEHVSVQKKTVTLGIAGLVTTVVVGGGFSIAAASGTSQASDPANSAQADSETADGADGGPGSEQEDPAFTGTVAAPAEAEQADGQETSASDAQEQAALQRVATVSQQQAEHAAVTAIPGTVAGTDLGAENGWVVYSVEVNGADGTVTEVTVDAGNGAVLAQQAQEAGDPQD